MQILPACAHTGLKLREVYLDKRVADINNTTPTRSPKHQISRSIRAPGLDQRKVASQRALHDVPPAVEHAHLVFVVRLRAKIAKRSSHFFGFTDNLCFTTTFCKFDWKATFLTTTDHLSHSPLDHSPRPTSFRCQSE
jgi:hypothetical protein